MKLIWAFEARKDRHAIFKHILPNNPAAALELDKKFLEAAKRLVDHPMLGRKGTAPATRELVVHQHYILIYAVAHGSVRVLRVMHTSRRWPLPPP